MRSASAGLKVGITVLLVIAIGWISFRFVAKGIHNEEGYEAWALFQDATGLVDKSRVQIAGIIVGEIRKRTLRGHFAKVVLRIKPDVAIWSNAVIYKKSASLLGEFYLDIDPGTPESPDPKSDQLHPNYLVKGCQDVTHDPDCNQIKNVVEVVTTTDVLTQMNETLPVLRDILLDVQKLTSGPMQDIARDVQSGVKANSAAAEKLLRHIDLIAQDLRTVTTPSGPVYQDLKESMANVRTITESVKDLIGTGQGQVNTAGDKLKRDLDQLSVTLDKFNRNLDQLSDLTGKVAHGEGTIGKLMTDDTIARNVGEIAEDTSNFVRSLTRLQTIVGIREEYNFIADSYKTYVSLRLQPRPDKYYLLEFIDDPRGSRSYSHTFQNTTGPGGEQNGNVNIDNWTRSSAFRFSFMFAKRLESKIGVGATGRIGLKESTGGVGLDFDAWRQRLRLTLDLFDFTAEKYPRLKVWAAIEVIKHAWLLGGVDDVINASTNAVNPGQTRPGDITCGPATPSSWCKGGRDYFIGAGLSFTDDDLRALLFVGASALGNAGGGK